MVWQILPLFNGFLIQHTVQTYTSVTNCIDLQASSLKKKTAIHKTNNIHIQCIPVGIQVKVTRHFWSLYHHWWHLKQKLESDGLTVWIYTLISSSCLIISHGKKRKQCFSLSHWHKWQSWTQSWMTLHVYTTWSCGLYKVWRRRRRIVIPMCRPCYACLLNFSNLGFTYLETGF